MSQGADDPTTHTTSRQPAASVQTASLRSRPIVIASHNGMRATERAAWLMERGLDPLDALLDGVEIIEQDPDEHSVGYGGLPTADGMVELDAAVMHGPSRGAGAVAALRHFRTPSRIARLVMQQTEHVMLAGPGACEFARAQGVPEEDLLTEETREAWRQWTRDHPSPDYRCPPEVPDEKPTTKDSYFTYGTIVCCALDAGGHLSGVTSTSGLSYRRSGRVADSSVIGAGLFVDDDVGAAAATGRGEAAIKICGSHVVVECMRRQASPVDACLEALHRAVRNTVEPWLKRRDGRPNYNLTFYAISKDGRCGAASLWSGARFALYADGHSRLEDCAYLFRRPQDTASSGSS